VPPEANWVTTSTFHAPIKDSASFHHRDLHHNQHEWLKNGMDVPVPEMAKLMAKLARDEPA
jgi:hypothetical protein